MVELGNKYKIGNTLVEFTVLEVIGAFGLISISLAVIFIIVLAGSSHSFDYAVEDELKFAGKMTFLIAYAIVIGIYLLAQIP